MSISMKLKFGGDDYWKNVNSGNPYRAIAQQIYTIIHNEYPSISAFIRVSGVNRKSLYNILNEKEFTYSQLVAIMPYLGEFGYNISFGKNFSSQT